MFTWLSYDLLARGNTDLARREHDFRRAEGIRQRIVMREWDR